jgi:protoporphyrin/coproporphyrin ferrochelatase
LPKPIVILCNLGGPTSLDEVEPFLLDLLGDPNVIRLPFFLKPFQQTLAKFIVKRRLPHSQKLYREIGGRSPLVALTKLQAAQLEQKTGLKTFILMACGKPGTNQLKEQLASYGQLFEQAIILPLFPQYSTTTSKSSLEQATAFFSKNYPAVQLKTIISFPKHSKFVAAWVERIQNKLRRIQGPVKLIFSAHGIPQSYVDSGDPYPQELKAGVSAIMQNFPKHEHILCFQSKFGRAKWLEPSTERVLHNLPTGSQALIVPISFVSDHVETIHEIGIEFAELAKERGIKLYRTPGLNSSGLFIECLSELVQDKLTVK